MLLILRGGSCAAYGSRFPSREIGHVDKLVDAFIRDELSKGRYDPAISGICFQMLLELFGRTLSSDLGPPDDGEQKIENVC